MLKASQKINALFTSNTTQSENKSIPKVNPPPIPRKIDNQSSELMKNIQVQIKREQQSLTNSKRTLLFRRGIMLVFEQTSFELLLQLPWIKKVLGNEIQICFERKFINDSGLYHIFEIVLRLKIIYAKDTNENLHDFLQDKTVNDEMSFRINEAFVIVRDEPLSHLWYNFLNKNSESKFIYYLSRNQLNQRHYNSFSLMETESLFITLIKRLLVINEHVEVSILNRQTKVFITDPKKFDFPTNNKESSLAISDSITNCMGHGGAVEKFSSCLICGGSLCSICLDSFLICPGSISTDLHKFTSKDTEQN